MKPPCGRRLVRRCPYRASAGVVGHRAHARETSKIEVVRAARLAEQHGSYFRRLALTATREAGALAAGGLPDTRGLEMSEQRQSRRAQARRVTVASPAIPNGYCTRSRSLVNGCLEATVVRGCRRRLRRAREFRMSRASEGGCRRPQHARVPSSPSSGTPTRWQETMALDAAALVVASRSHCLFASGATAPGCRHPVRRYRSVCWGDHVCPTPKALHQRCTAFRIARSVALAERTTPGGASSSPSA